MAKIHGKATITINGERIEPFAYTLEEIEAAEREGQERMRAAMRDVFERASPFYGISKETASGRKLCLKAKVRVNSTHDVFTVLATCDFDEGHEGSCSFDCIETTAREKSDERQEGEVQPGSEDTRVRRRRALPMRSGDASGSADGE